MDTRFLHSLINVIDSGSIAAAARRENVTAAAISQRIKALENTLKCHLLTRSGHSAKPTDDCLRILPRLKTIAEQVAFISDDLDINGLSGTLNIGVISSVLSSLMPSCIQHLGLHTPNLLLKIVPGSSREIYQKLIEKQIDIAIIVAPPFKLPKIIKQTHLFNEPLILLSHTAQLNLANALKQPFIEYDKNSWGGAIANQYIQDHKLTTNTLCAVDSLESIALMVKQNMGVSLIPLWQGLDSIAPQAKITHINDMTYQRSIHLLTHRQSGKEKLVTVAEQAIKQTFLTQNQKLV